MATERKKRAGVAPPEGSSEPDYTGLEQYIVPALHPEQPPKWDAPGVKALPPEPGKLTVKESLQLLKHLPPTDDDSTELIRRMRDAR